MEDHNKILDRAYALGVERHPNAPAEHHASFANSVAYCVAGWSGGFGGPSMREHLACRVAHTMSTVGEFAFDTAVSIVEGTCYDPLTRAHAEMLTDEHCFDDAPGEVEEARRLLVSQ